MIGSRCKVLSVYQALEREGFAPALFDRVNAPVGLEIGALTPEEIAISITAELIAVRRGAANLAHKAVVRKDDRKEVRKDDQDQKEDRKHAAQPAEAKADVKTGAKAAAESVSRCPCPRARSRHPLRRTDLS